MEPLFSVGPVYDKHVSGIIKSMLLVLKNNRPSTDSKVYVKNANYIKELYDGTFLSHKFDFSKSKSYNMNGTFEKVRACKGDWNIVRKTVLDSIKHLEMAKDTKYMPFNKNYIDSITFSTFFEAFTPGCFSGEISSCFLSFVNEPKPCYEYSADLTIEKLKKDCSKMILDSGEKLCKKYFAAKHQQLSFWYNMKDWSRWINQLKKHFNVQYQEFLLCCLNGNPLLDFRGYLIDYLKYKQGENYIVMPEHFQLSRKESCVLEGMVKYWLNDGLNKNKFNCFKQLPNSIINYYTNESFEIKTVVQQKKQAVKETVDFEDFVF